MKKRLFFLLLVIMPLASCGVKGPLHLPNHHKASKETTN